MSIEKGSLIAVIGKIGSGKSSLISAIFGDMYRPEGEVVRYGNVAFVPQQAWIQNSTLRQNILFGKEFDEILYERVLDACALLPDLEVTRIFLPSSVVYVLFLGFTCWR